MSVIGGIKVHNGLATLNDGIDRGYIDAGDYQGECISGKGQLFGCLKHKIIASRKIVTLGLTNYCLSKRIRPLSEYAFKKMFESDLLWYISFFNQSSHVRGANHCLKIKYAVENHHILIPN